MKAWRVLRLRWVFLMSSSREYLRTSGHTGNGGGDSRLHPLAGCDALVLLKGEEGVEEAVEHPVGEVGLDFVVESREWISNRVRCCSLTLTRALPLILNRGIILIPDSGNL
jgi:hypothetical protein